MITEIICNVSGIVQGVGFRPLCVRIAHRCGISGSVANTSDGVLLTLRGEKSDIERFLRELRRDCPDVALIVDLKITSEKQIEQRGDDFVILKSVRSERQRVLLPPDMATCADCLDDIRNPHNRRYRYPFTNCTNCGPRFSIVKTLPYDRPCTTMSEFIMCDKCSGEYTDETDRRFHAQPNACPECGPQLSYCADGKELASGEDALQMAVGALKDGKIIAIKGLGGFHLACDAKNDETVGLLRARKKRPTKPFAIMAKDVRQINSLVKADENAIATLSGARAPIVLLEKKAPSELSPSLAPGLKKLGVMLPYTPLHHLLLESISPLVMTSANLSGDALIADNAQALMQLAHICDGFLLHDRKIHMKIDDSVLLPHADGNIITRRARGYVPNPVILKKDIAPVFTAGAEMKSTFAYSQDNMIFPSQYLGDLKNLDNAAFYSEALRHFRQLYNFAPCAIAYDMHPLYMSRSIALKSYPDLPATEIQHHHAHMAACMAENGYDGKAIGLIMDGTGYGTDGTVWGGEVLCGNALSVERTGHLKTFSLPGGDRVIKEIWRTGFSLLVETVGEDAALELCERLWRKGKIAEQILKAWKSYPICSSCGRLFDGIAAIVLGKPDASYDGEAPMLLEATAESPDAAYPQFGTSSGIIDWRPFVSGLIKNVRTGAHGAAYALHSNLAMALTNAAVGAAKDTGTDTVVLSGGCWQNALLLDTALPMLRSKGLTVLTHRLISPNDECISVGQAYVLGSTINQ